METHWDHETVKVSDIKKLIAQAHAILCIVIHALDTKVLVGEINRPGDPAEKKPRKKRTRKAKVAEFPPPKVETPLPSDDDHPFYGKKKREKKEPIEQ